MIDHSIVLLGVSVSKGDTTVDARAFNRDPTTFIASAPVTVLVFLALFGVTTAHAGSSLFDHALKGQSRIPTHSDVVFVVTDLSTPIEDASIYEDFNVPVYVVYADAHERLRRRIQAGLDATIKPGLGATEQELLQFQIDVKTYHDSFKQEFARSTLETLVAGELIYRFDIPELPTAIQLVEGSQFRMTTGTIDPATIAQQLNQLPYSQETIKQP